MRVLSLQNIHIRLSCPCPGRAKCTGAHQRETEASSDHEDRTEPINAQNVAQGPFPLEYICQGALLATLAAHTDVQMTIAIRIWHHMNQSSTIGHLPLLDGDNLQHPPTRVDAVAEKLPGSTHTLWCSRRACVHRTPERAVRKGMWGVRDSKPEQRSQMWPWMSCALQECRSTRVSP